MISYENERNSLHFIFSAYFFYCFSVIITAKCNKLFRNVNIVTIFYHCKIEYLLPSMLAGKWRTLSLSFCVLQL